jgi:hypothetical protein
MRVVVAVAFLTFLVGNALACEYREKKSPCCDDGVGLNNDVYLFTYYAWAGVYYYHTGIKAYGRYYFYNSGDNLYRMKRQSIRSLIPWKEGIVTPRSSCGRDPNNGNYTFWKRQFIGKTSLTEDQFVAVLKELHDDSYWQKYHVLKRNCNHFTREVASRLGLSSEYDDKLEFKFPGFSIAK